MFAFDLGGFCLLSLGLHLSLPFLFWVSGFLDVRVLVVTAGLGLMFPVGLM